MPAAVAGLPSLSFLRLPAILACSIRERFRRRLLGAAEALAAHRPPCRRALVQVLDKRFLSPVAQPFGGSLQRLGRVQLEWTFLPAFWLPPVFFSAILCVLLRSGGASRLSARVT